MSGTGLVGGKTGVSHYFWLAVPLLAAIYSITRMFPVLPAVMQDEYVYSMEARYLSLAEAAHPNYLFSLLYGTTDLCGTEFYGCVKGLNSIFFLGTIALIWLIGNRLFGFAAATLAATITAISPIAVNVSFFMPDSMYYFFVILTIYLALFAARRSSFINWSMVALVLALTALVKPHGVLLLPALLIFSALVMRKNESLSWVRLAVRQLSMVAVFFMIKFGLGFILAGPSGLSIFGTNYSGAIDKFVEGSASQDGELSPSPAATQSAGSGSEVTEGLLPPGELATVPTNPSGFFEVFFSQLIGQYSYVLLLAGLPLLLGIRAIRRVVSEREEVREQSAFVILVTLLTASMIPAIAGFQGIAATLGENTGERVISRHYEFLVPLFVLAGFSLLRFVEPGLKSKLVQAGAVFAAVIYSWVWLTSSVIPKFADSSSLMGLLGNPVALPLLAILVLGTVAYWLFNSERAAQALAWAVIPLLVVTAGLIGQARLYETIGVNKAYFDVAGETAKPLLAGVPGEEIVVVGAVRPAAFTAKFWIDRPGIADVITTQDGQDVSNLVSSFSYALILGTSTVSIPHEELASGEGFKLVRLIK